MTNHTFHPWELRDGQLIRSPQSEWQKPVKWNREARAAQDAWDAIPTEELTEFPPDTPVVTCSTDLFTDWDGPVVNKRGSRLYKTRKPGKYIPSEDTLRLSQLDNPCTTADLLTDFFRLADSCQNLDWQIRTAHPENVRRMWPTVFGDAYERAIDTNENRGHPRQFRPNIHLDAIAATQYEADERIPELLKCRDLVGSVGLWWTGGGALVLDSGPRGGPPRYLTGEVDHGETGLSRVTLSASIEPDAPPLDLQSVRDVRDQCVAAGVVFRIERLGANLILGDIHGWQPESGITTRILLGRRWVPDDRTGSDPEEWPSDLREHAA